MDETRERALRRPAVRLWLQAISPQAIATRLQRSARWMHKWLSRYQRGGGDWARSRSRRPHRLFRYDAQTRAAVIRVRKQLAKSPVGLVGPKEIQATLRQQRVLKQVPALSTMRAHAA